MNDDHLKLVAKIQYFYDVMISRLENMEDRTMTSICTLESNGCKQKSIELNYLADEFSKTFDNLLYKETNEK